MRAAYLANALGQPTGDAGVYFVERLLVQLSYSEIRDSRYDVGEVVFALEGALLCHSDGVSQPLIDRVADVIRYSQEHDPSMEARSPFRITPAGAANRPISVEVASSLLRAAWMIEANRPESKFFGSLRGVFRGYFERLLSTVEVVKWRGDKATKTVDLRGWRSEHTLSSTPTIHTWYTSQVILLLASYRAMLGRHVANSSLLAARFSTPLRPAEAARAEWDILRGEREPLHGSNPDSEYRVYDRVDDAFVAPRLGGPPPKASHSLVLYGPPSTGKTSLVKSLAAALGWRMIAISPSDFVVGGESQVEARAKDIFKVLQYQTDTVVLFDEIDRLVLDRDSPEYGRQSDTFQFMTPAMLPKLQELNDRGRNILCIATNYAWRIDRAITRPGRIDRRYLLLPPDQARREQIVMTLLGRQGGLPDSRATQVAASSPLLTYTELKSVVDSVGNGARTPRLVEACKRVTPAASAAPYRRTLGKMKDRRREPAPALIEEFLLLRYLELEAAAVLGQHQGLPDADWDLVGGESALKEVRDPAVHGVLKPGPGRSAPA